MVYFRTTQEIDVDSVTLAYMRALFRPIRNSGSGCIWRWREDNSVCIVIRVVRSERTMFKLCLFDRYESIDTERAQSFMCMSAMVANCVTDLVGGCEPFI